MPVSATPDLLADWTSTLVVSSGQVIRIRPLLPDDRDRERAFIASLSERSRYFRLFTPLKFLRPQLLDQLMDIDYRYRMALVATIERDGSEEFVGIARYAQTAAPDTIELGVTVTDVWQRRGIAKRLVTELIDFARLQGFRHMSGVVLPENLGMLAFAKSLGFAVAYDREEHLSRIARDICAGPTTPEPAEPRAGCGEVRGSR